MAYLLNEFDEAYDIYEEDENEEVSGGSSRKRKDQENESVGPSGKKPRTQIQEEEEEEEEENNYYMEDDREYEVIDDILHERTEWQNDDENQDDDEEDEEDDEGSDNREEFRFEDFDQDSQSEGEGSNRVPKAQEKKRFRVSEIDELRRKLIPVFNMSKRRKKRKDDFPDSGKGKGKLPPYLSKTMGDANMAFSVGDFAEAIILLHEVIRHAPFVAAPYSTMGLVYHEMGEHHKAIQYKILGALLSPSDASNWKELGISSREYKMYSQGIYCLNRALKLKPKDPEIIFERACIHTEMNDLKKAGEGFRTVMKLKPNDPQITQEYAKYLVLKKDYGEAVEVLEHFIESNGDLDLDLNTMNMLAELYNLQGEFEKAKQFIENVMKICQEPIQNFPLDFQINYAVCHIYLNQKEKIQDILERLDQCNLETFGDLYQEVAYAFFGIHEYENALKIFRKIVSEPQFNGPSLWLKMAECLIELQDFDSSVALLTAVLEAEPNSNDSKIMLAGIYEKQGKHAEAAELLSTTTAAINEKTNSEKPKRKHFTPKRYKTSFELKMKKLEPLKETKQQRIVTLYREFLGLCDGPSIECLPCAEQLFKYFMQIMEPLERKFGQLYYRTKKFSDDRVIDLPQKEVLAISIDDWFDVILKLFDGYIEKEEPEKAFSVIKTAGRSLLFYHEPEKLKTMNILSLTMAIYLSRLEEATDFIRYLIRTSFFSENENSVWNFFSILFSVGGSKAGSALCSSFLIKFVRRMQSKYSSVLSFWLFCGYQMLLSGTIHLAIGFFKRAYSKASSHPLTNLCLGISLLQQSIQKRQTNKPFLILQAFSFLFRYYELSQFSEESAFNIARAFHQIGFYHLAVAYYQKVLDSPTEDPKAPKFEAAVNLSHIYSAIGSTGLAQVVLRKYASI